MIDLDTTKNNFASFISDRERSEDYMAKRYRDFDKKKFPLVSVIIACLLIVTVIAIPAGLVMLIVAFRMRKTPRDDIKLSIPTQRVVQTFTVCSNSDVADPTKAGATLAVGSYEEPSPELERVCQRVTKQLQHLFVRQQADDPAEEALFAFLMDEKNVHRPKRLIPKQYTDGKVLYAFNIAADKACIDESFDPYELAGIGFDGIGELDSIPVECVKRVSE